MNRTKFWRLLPLSFYHSVSDVTEPEPSGGNPGGGSLYTFGEADGGKLGLGKNVTSEADVPTRVDIPDESVSGNLFYLIRLPKSRTTKKLLDSKVRAKITIKLKIKKISRSFLSHIENIK